MNRFRFLLGVLAAAAIGTGLSFAGAVMDSPTTYRPPVATSTTSTSSTPPPTLPVGSPESATEPSSDVPVEIAPGTTVERPECPVDGTPYAFGSCVPAAGVLPAPPVVEGGAPSQTCVYGETLFECPAGYEPPTYESEPPVDEEPQPATTSLGADGSPS